MTPDFMEGPSSLECLPQTSLHRLAEPTLIAAAIAVDMPAGADLRTYWRLSAKELRTTGWVASYLTWPPTAAPRL